MATILTVSQINTYLKSVFDGDFNLKNIYVSGEISNFTNHYRTGHFYFTLKDERASVKAVMFRSAAQRLRFLPENGLRVIVRCSVSIFERDGVYQLYCEDMQPDGAGALQLAFEQLKDKLSQMGLFDDAHKKPLPPLPRRIGVVTSPTGAAVHDILTVLERRYPAATVILEGVQVQGDAAAPQIAAAIDKFNALQAADVLIVGRGGGSMEDLWAFNEELVALAAYRSEIPIVSAVGHETDFTILDFVADCRAPTPSAAAELVAPDTRELLFSLDATLDRLIAAMQTKCADLADAVSDLAYRLTLQSPKHALLQREALLTAQKNELNNAMRTLIQAKQQQLGELCARLENANPLAVLARGYAVVKTETGAPLHAAAGVSAGERIDVCFSDGSLRCTVDTASLKKG